MGGLIPSPYEEIKVVPFGHYVDIHDSSVEFRDNEILQDDLSHPANYLDDGMEAAFDIRRSIIAAANVPASHRIVQLTGGFDSRVVLGGLLREKRQHDFLYFTSGQPGLADRDIADGLIQRYGLSRASSSGQAEVLIEDIGDRLQVALSASSGLSTEGPTAFEHKSDILVLGGVYGENLRTMYAEVSRLWAEGERSPDLLMQAMWGRGVMNEDGLLDREFQQRISSIFMESLYRIQDSGYPDDAIGDGHYLLYRNRYYSGQLLFRWNRFHARHDPIYSRAALRMSRSLPLEARRLNVAGFDLLSHLNTDLTSLPFAYPRFGKDFEVFRRLPRVQSLTNSGTIPVVEIPVPSVEIDETQNRSAGPMDRKKALELARKLNAAFWQVQNLPVAQEVLKNALLTADRTDIAGVFNTDYLEKLATSRLTNRVDIRRVYHVLGTLNWYTT